MVLRRSQDGATPLAADLPTERPHPRADDLDALPTIEIVQLLLDEEVHAAQAVARHAAAIAVAADQFARTLERGGRVVYVGAGTSGRLGALDAAELIPTFGLAEGRVVAVLAGGQAALLRAVEGAEDRQASAGRALRRISVGAADLVVGIAASGVTPFTRAALRTARSLGAATLLITCGTADPAAADTILAIPVGPEVLAGSTRLKAGTATKLILNALSTAAMVRIGKVFRGRMIDLHATNAKLRARALRILTDLCPVDEARATALLDEAGGHLRPALTAALLGCSVRRAELLLARGGSPNLSRPIPRSSPRTRGRLRG